MVILAVDYGDTRTGIALCDALEMMAFPKTVIKGYNIEKVADAIISEALESKAELIVVGNPKNMDGSEGETAELIREFAEKASDRLGIPYEFVDERLSTVSAHKILNDVNMSGSKKRRNVVDTVSAVIILQSYLDR